MMTPTKRAPHIPVLTSLRFIAALWVVLYHYNVLIAYPPLLKQFIGQGGAGVCFFFILSGFVLTYNYVDWFRTDISRYRFFLQARFARLYPAHVTALLCITPVVLYFYTFHPDIVKMLPVTTSTTTIVLSWIANLLLINEHFPSLIVRSLWNSPSWSINDEFIFYLLFPFVVKYILSRINQRRVLSFSVGIYLIECLLYVLLLLFFSASGSLNEMSWFIGTTPLIRIGDFLIGCMLSIIYSQVYSGAMDSCYINSLRRLSTRNVLVTGSITVVLAIALLPVPDGTAIGTIVYYLQDYILYIPPFAVLILALATGPTKLSAALAHPWLVRLGEASYALYILHWIPLMVLVYVAQLGTVFPDWYYLLAIAGTALLAVAFENWIERPLRHAIRSRLVV